MRIKHLEISNLLSFGPESETVALGPLNVLIGPNGSGKSNLIDCIGLLQAAPGELSRPIREGGGVQGWLWGGPAVSQQARLSAAMWFGEQQEMSLQHSFTFSESGARFALVEESLTREWSSGKRNQLYRFLPSRMEKPELFLDSGESRELDLGTREWGQSVVAHTRDRNAYPAIWELEQFYRGIRIYRDWCIGRGNPLRFPQKADLPDDSLLEDCTNLGMVLNRLLGEPPVKRKILEALRLLYEGITDIHIRVFGGTTQLFLHEGDLRVPATRLSDGTLRYLCLLATLCDPEPPTVVCIEEPELGLHPDIISNLAALLREASERCQVIVTTHAEVLVDAMTEQPDCILVCEKEDRASRLRRLDSQQLSTWLKEYRLGELWSSGQIGGNRW